MRDVVAAAVVEVVVEETTATAVALVEGEIDRLK